MKISILTPTIRPEALKLVQKSLMAQKVDMDWEWLIGSAFDPKIDQAIWVKDDFQGGKWSLNRIYNRLFKQAKGQIIISWQDFIYAPADTLQKFVDDIEVTDGGIITAVGDQYERLGEFGKPEVCIWSDPRKRLDQGSFYEIFPQDCEWNLCAFPKSYIFEIGGMDEQLDMLGYGGDQLQVGERWDASGKRFYIDQTIESFTLRHNRDDFGGQEKWDASHVLFAKDGNQTLYEKRILELKQTGQWPILTYLV